MSWQELILTFLGLLLVLWGSLELILRRGFRIHWPPPSWLGEESKPMDPLSGCISTIGQGNAFGGYEVVLVGLSEEKKEKSFLLS